MAAAGHRPPAEARAAALAAGINDTAGSPMALLTEGLPPEPLRHYPHGDVYDRATHAQFYGHTHRAGEHGHIHLFLRPRGMPAALRPLHKPAEPDAPCHLVAVGFGADGWPNQLFTTNRWVTGEAWYPADAVAAMLEGFRVSTNGPLAPLAALMTELVAFYRPVIAALAERRDSAVAAWGRDHPGIDPLEDPALEITSAMSIDLRTGF